MSKKRPPDSSKDEVRLIQATLKERYGHGINAQLAAAEITAEIPRKHSEEN